MLMWNCVQALFTKIAKCLENIASKLLVHIRKLNFFYLLELVVEWQLIFHFRHKVMCVYGILYVFVYLFLCKDL